MLLQMDYIDYADVRFFHAGFKLYYDAVEDVTTGALYPITDELAKHLSNDGDDLETIIASYVRQVDKAFS